MKFTSQLARRRDQLKRTNASLAALTGSTPPHISNVLSGKKDARESTLAALAGALDAQWVLIPKHLLPEIERLLSGKPLGPDQVPSTMEQILHNPGALGGSGNVDGSGKTSHKGQEK